MYIVKDRMLGPKNGRAFIVARASRRYRGEGDGSVEFDFDHVTGRHSISFRVRVNEGFIEVENKSLLRLSKLGGP